jgi:hypothetical protein
MLNWEPSVPGPPGLNARWNSLVHIKAALDPQCVGSRLPDLTEEPTQLLPWALFFTCHRYIAH